MRSVLFLLALILSFSFGQDQQGAARADIEARLNLNFEHSDGDQPADWASSGWRNAPYKVYLTRSEAYQGRQSVAFRCAAQACGSGASGVVTKRLFAESLVGKQVRLRGFLKTDGVEGGHAGLWMRVDGASVEGRPEELAYDDMSDRGAVGTQGWTPYEMVLEVPEGARDLFFGARFTGRGGAWADALELSVSDPATGTYTPVAEVLSAAELAEENFRPPAELLAWLGENAVPLETVTPIGFEEDLEPFKAIVGNARVVALGEATHGTSEFFKLKHRLVQFLADEMGFTVFSIEANMPEAYRMNEYVLTGEGDPRELLKGMYFWIWNTQEVLDMILWMRAFNASGAGVMQFTGFDMQTPTVAMDEVRAFVARYDPGYVGELSEAYETVAASYEVLRGQYGRPSPKVTEWRDAASRVLEHLESNQQTYTDATPAELAWALQNARVVLQGAEDRAGEVPRAESMAENIAWILEENPDAKVVLWAHNAHVGESSRGYPSMGRSLAERYGEDYLSLGFTFYEGEYTARERETGAVRTHAAGPASAESVGGTFHALGLPLFALDLRGAEQDPAAAWLTRPQDVRMMGAVAVDDEQAFSRSVLLEDYDVVVFVDRMTATDPLP